MPRKLVAVLISLFAVGFAFAAMAAIRWPTIMLAVGFLHNEEAGAALAGVNWRQLGLIHGAPYFIASLSLYAASAMVARRQRGAVAWYLMGCLAGFPCIYLVSFESGWWRDPSAGEGIVAGLGAVAVLLFFAVWDLRRKPVRAAPAASPEEAMVSIPASLLAQLQPAAPVAESGPKARARPRSAAIRAAQASYVREGRKMLARQAARRPR